MCDVFAIFVNLPIFFDYIVCICLIRAEFKTFRRSRKLSFSFFSYSWILCVNTRRSSPWVSWSAAACSHPHLLASKKKSQRIVWVGDRAIYFSFNLTKETTFCFIVVYRYVSCWGGILRISTMSL